MSQGGAFVDLGYDGHHMYACGISDITPGELLRSADDGETWTSLTGHGHTAMTSIAFGEGLFVGGDNGVTRSLDNGESWEFIGASLPPGETVWCLAAGNVSGDVINPHAMAGTDSGLYEAYEFGMDDWDWQQLVPDACVAIAQLWVPAPWPINVIVHYAVVTADGRILFSTSGAVWSDETGDLPDAAVDVAYSPWDRGIYVCTASGGVFRYQHAITPVEETPGAPLRVALRAWPNPFNPRVNLRFELPADGRATLRVLDLAGREVATLREGWFTAGRHDVAWEATGLASGVYLAEVRSATGRAASRLVLVR
jgi:hypothetical protein